MDIAPGLLEARTFTLGHGRGAVEVRGGVAGAGDAVILAEVWLVGAHGTADAAVDAGIVVMTRGALNCGERGEENVLTGIRQGGVSSLSRSQLSRSHSSCSSANQTFY